QPTFATSGNPPPTVTAFIGATGTISVSGSTPVGFTQGPVDVSTGGFQFSSLNPNTSYTILVIAQNSVGYATQQIIQSTAGIAPVLSGLVINATDSSSIMLAQPTLATAGN